MECTQLFRHDDVCWHPGLLGLGAPPSVSCASPPVLPRLPRLPLPSRVVCASASTRHPNLRTVSVWSVCTLSTQMCTPHLVTLPFLSLSQILGPLDHDDQCGKQKLAYKLEQVITLMSLDS